MARYKFNVGDKFEVKLGTQTVVAEIVERTQVFSCRYNLYELAVDKDSEHPVMRLMNEFQLVKMKRVSE